MRQLQNGWVKYWDERVSKNQDYYGKKGSNADKIIHLLRIDKKDVVLDIGCAIGAHLTDIHKKTGARCYGIDISPQAIRLNKNKKISLRVGDMEKTGFSDKSFTKVFALGVFEHTPRSESVFRELNRVMKEEGYAHITVPNKYSFFHITKNIKMLKGTWGLGYERSFTKSELIKILSKTGFSLEKYWVEPHLVAGNIFNRGDNLLNKQNNQHFGFFINTIIKKVRDV